MNSKSKSNRRGISWSAESYHAGLSAARRTSIQKQFMAGKLRIVVATVAFGMGINKSDIRAIIHYNAPKNFENYVQEMGRAGRDGLPAHCHVFLNSEVLFIYYLFFIFENHIILIDNNNLIDNDDIDKLSFNLSLIITLICYYHTYLLIYSACLYTINI